MKSMFVGYFRPKEDALLALWNDCIFVVDANVLLNLYRYSTGTRLELEKALENIKDRAFIPHQAAKEFLKNRLSVTAGQAKEYASAIKTINELVANLSSKDRHPFLSDEELPNFTKYSEKLVSTLESQQTELFNKFSDDEILIFVEQIFDGKTGKQYDEIKLGEIVKEGEGRYQKEIPPGYKDSKKESTDDPYRKFGDLIVWKQTIDYSKDNKKPVIFITDDKKEDWWLEQSGRTIGPRPELIEEFCKSTKQKFWMYSVDRFIQESAKISKTTVSEDVIQEILKVSQESKTTEHYENSPISVIQEITERTEVLESGRLVVNLNRNMRYATGTGKFNPWFSQIPSFEVELVSTPCEDTENVGLSYGCGTVKNFNVHIKAKNGLLDSGDYVFKYTAKISETDYIA